MRRLALLALGFTWGADCSSAGSFLWVAGPHVQARALGDRTAVLLIGTVGPWGFLVFWRQ